MSNEQVECAATHPHPARQHTGALDTVQTATSHRHASAVTELQEFDPWYVMLSPSKRSRHRTGRTEALPSGTPRSERLERLDLEELFSSARIQARKLIDARMRELRPLSKRDRLLKLLASQKYRRGSMIDFHSYRDELDRKSKAPTLEYVLPSFPFKIPNPHKCQHSNLDMAEALCLSRLLEISELTSLIMEKPCSFIAISDGELYRPVARVDPGVVRAYFQTIDAWVSLSDDGTAAATLRFIDMVRDVIDPNDHEYQRHIESVRARVKEWWQSNSAHDKVQYLEDNMFDNTDLSLPGRRLLEDAAFDGEPNPIEIAAAARSQARSSAIEFTSVLVTLRELKLLNQVFPNAWRATVHPKPGQLGFHLVNQKSTVFPWQGVALRLRSGEWRIVREDYARGNSTTLVRDESTLTPLYFAE